MLGVVCNMDWLRKMLGQEVWEGTDRRQSLRASCNFEVQVSGAKCSFWGRSKDIGPSGLRVEAKGAFPGALKVGIDVEVKHLDAPFNAELHTVAARVAWVRKIHASQFQCGLLFVDNMETMRRTWVKSVLASTIKQSPQQKRRYLRVRTDLTLPGTCNGDICQVRLRDLSMTGARFETIRELHEGDRLSIKLQDLTLPCEIRRISKTGGSYLVGVRFGAAFQEQKKLLAIIKSLSAKA